MKIMNKIALLILAAALVEVPHLYGGLIDLSNQANVILIGSVASRTESPTQVTFTIVPGRLLKGTVTSGQINVVHPWNRGKVLYNPPVFTTTQALYGMWFLTESSSGTWDVLQARPDRRGMASGLFLPASPSRPNYPTNAALSDALAYELAEGIQLSGDDPEILLGAIYSLGGVPVDSPAIESILAGYLSSGQPDFEVAGLAGSLQRGVSGSIQELSSLWPTISSSPHIYDVISGVRDFWRDPTSVQDLVSLAQSAAANSPLREAAIRALAAIHNSASLPFLASLLSSSNPSEQERAVYGLSAFVNGCPMQTPGNSVSLSYLQCTATSYTTADTKAHFGFQKGTPDQESTLATYWQNWWNAHPELH